MMKNKYSLEFLQQIPKTDIHLHLDGSLRLDSFREMCEALNIQIPANDNNGLIDKLFKKKYQSLEEYLNCFAYTTKALRKLEHIERAGYELAIDNQNENVFYIEVRFAPQLLIDYDKGLDLESILCSLDRGLKRAQQEFNSSQDVLQGVKPQFHYGIITCAMRYFGPQGFSPYYTQLYKNMSYSRSREIIAMAALELARASVKLRDEKQLPIVGIDLAGQEEGYPAHHFKQAYLYAHKNFLHKTVHAGEAYGAESVFQAISECFADRIGHGYSMFMPELIRDESIEDKEKYIEHLCSFIADRRTLIEVCLSSNLQTNPLIKDLKNHKFQQMLDNRMAVTLCTDNRLVSHTTVTKEYQLACNHFDIPLKRLKDIVAYGFKKSFYPGSYVEKRKYAKEAMNYFDKVVSKHGYE